MKLIHKCNKIIIKKYPAVWMSAFFIIFPTAIILFVLGFSFGWSNPAINLDDLMNFQIWISFVVCLIVIFIQLFRLIKQITFKTLLYFFLFCSLSHACVFLTIFSPTLAINYKLQNYGINKVYDDMETYQKYILESAFMNDPIVDSIRAVKEEKDLALLIRNNFILKNPFVEIFIIPEDSELSRSYNYALDFQKDSIYSLMIEKSIEENFEDSLLLKKIVAEYLNYNYYFNPYSREEDDHMKIYQFMDSLWSNDSHSFLISNSSKIDDIAKNYSLPIPREYSVPIVSKTNQENFKLGGGDVGDLMSIILQNVTYLRTTKKFLSFILFFYIITISGVVFLNVTLKAAIWSSLISIVTIFLPSGLFFTYLNKHFSYEDYIEFPEFSSISMYILFIFFMIIVIAFSWAFFKKYRSVSWRYIFVVQQANFLLVSFAMIMYFFLEEFLSRTSDNSLLQIESYLQFFVFAPLFLIPFNLIFLKIYHKLFNLPKA